MVFREGKRSSYFYVVAEGEVALELGVPQRHAVEIFTVGAGQLLGWTPYLGRGPMTATARCRTPCRLITFDAAKVLVLCTQDTHFGYEFVRRAAQAIAERLAATRQQLLDLCLDVLPVVTEEGGEG